MSLPLVPMGTEWSTVDPLFRSGWMASAVAISPLYPTNQD